MTRWMVVVAALSASACEKNETAGSEAEANQGTTSAPTPEVELPPEPPPPKLTDLSLAEVLDKIRPEITDAVDSYSSGQIKLVLWAAVKLKWADVDVRKNETSEALVKKDSGPQVGKRMCVKARISQIMKDEADGKKIFTGLLMRGYRPTSFIAVGSTGELVERSRARFCGLVAGNYAFRNVGGGQTQTVLLVGMFDLPENRGAAAEAD